MRKKERIALARELLVASIPLGWQDSFSKQFLRPEATNEIMKDRPPYHWQCGTLLQTITYKQQQLSRKLGWAVQFLDHVAALGIDLAFLVFIRHQHRFIADDSCNVSQPSFLFKRIHAYFVVDTGTGETRTSGPLNSGEAWCTTTRKPARGALTI